MTYALGYFIVGALVFGGAIAWQEEGEMTDQQTSDSISNGITVGLFWPLAFVVWAAYAIVRSFK